MNSVKLNARVAVCLALVLLCLGFAPQSSLAQTVSASPVALSYGVPTGTAAVAPDLFPASSQETLTVNITGASAGSPVTFGTTTVTGPNKADFITAGDSCSGQTFTASATCLVTLYFNASLAPATTLETATLTLSITSGATAPPPVPLSGAFGSIKLFGETNVAAASSSSSFTNLYTIATTTQNLNCPTSPTATLSGSPDGLGNLLVDNYITLATGSPLAPVTGIETNFPPGNLCSGNGSTADSFGENDYQNCFTANYALAARYSVPPPGIIGLDPDTFANAPNSVLAGAPSNPGGIGPISIASFLTSGTQQALFSLLSSGAASDLDYANSTLFLATSCSPAGVVPGATVTGNPTPTNTVTVDSSPGQSCSFVDSSAQNPSTPGTTPVYTEVAVPQQLFYELVAGTSAAPDVCFRAGCEQDTANNSAPMCAGILIQCWDPSHTTLSGANCESGQVQSAMRNLYFSFAIDSPDAPLNGTNYLYNSSPNACTYSLTGGNSATGLQDACATSTGPGLLAGGDAWACAPGSQEPCTPLEPNSATSPIFNTSTPASTSIYSQANCVLTGEVAGDLCPLDLLTQLNGAADIPPAGGKTNSLYFPVANHPLPTASVTVGQNGWVNGSSAPANFTSSAATYPGSVSPTVPPANGFAAAPMYSVTYGITSATSPLPDPTYPVPGDVTVWNSGANPDFGNPLCSSAPSSFSPTVSLLSLTSSQPDGLYNLHYFPTDCALTEGLVFNPQGSALTNPTTNWASFPFAAFGIDTVAPSVSSCIAPSPVYNGIWYGANFSVSCTVQDNAASNGSYSGFLPLVSGIQGTQTEAVNIYTNVAAGTATTSAMAGAEIPGFPVGTGSVPSAVQVSDLAGNPVSGGVSAGPYEIDLQAPTITGPTLSASGPYYVNGPPVTVSFSCSDGAGSGVKSCSGTEYLPGGGSMPISNGGAITNTVVGNYSIVICAIDNVGNRSTSAPLYFTITPSSTTTLTSSQNPSVSGKSVTFTATVTLSPPGTATGTVQFLDGATVLKTVALKSGSAKYITAALPAGSNSMTAVYSGDAGNSGSTSNVVIQIVQAPTTITLRSTPNPSDYGQTVTFTAEVTSSIGAPPDGELVSFKIGSTVLGTGALSGGIATFPTSTLGEGDQLVTAVYGGDTNFTTSKSEALSQVVNAVPTTTMLMSSQNPSTPGQSVTFTATVTSLYGSGPVPGNITFMNGSTKLKVVALSGGTATYTTTKLATGSNTITATYFSYSGNKNYASSSATITQTVGFAP